MAPTGTPSASTTRRPTPASATGRNRPSGSGRSCRWRAGPQPRRPTAAPHGVLAGQQQRTEEHEDEGEGAGGRLVEPDLELVVDLRRQRLVAQDLEGAELGQHDQPDEDRSPEDRQPGLAHRDRPEGAHPAEPEAARHLLLRRVRRAQAGRHREEHQGVDGQGHHQHGGPEPADGRKDRSPSEAHDEVRDAEWDDDQDGEEPAARARPSAPRTRRSGCQRSRSTPSPPRPSETVFQISVAVRLRNRSWCNWAHPTCTACTTRNARGKQHGDRHEDGPDGEKGGKRRRAPRRPWAERPVVTAVGPPAAV